MRSAWSFWASLVLLGTLPMAFVGQAAFGVDAELVVHLGLGLGCALVRPLNFKAPAWLTLLGGSAALVLELTFFLQFAAQVLVSSNLHWLAFDILGQWPESLFISLLMVWLAGLLLTDARGATRVLGWICVPPAIAVMVFSYVAPLFGISFDETYPQLKILLLVPFVWLAFESRKPASGLSER